MNHIPDTGKLVSDTPRTDAELVEMTTGYGPVVTETTWVHSSLCFQLERELNAANADVERLTKANLQLRKGCEELQQRIKRLEDSRDKIKIYCDTSLARDWKEAKL